ncbi:MAG: thiamine pyrophosphate-binding protein [Thermodesulfobacteriota bacterium]|nr:thiamine pyrophosphate-binding protein [Thermodesulfobacteriota bacterium]
MGVCLVTTGPGGASVITRVAGAWMDSTPLLMISG